jgi:hypothetical protein
MEFRALIVMAVFLLISTTEKLCGQPAAVAATSGVIADQHFVCNTGYARSACHAQVQHLALELSTYGDVLPRDWTWVLVRSRDWQTILLGLRLDPQIPAFTVLEQRRTFLSEALFEPDAYSGAELLRTFRVPLDQILDVAITHELGHAYCGDTREGEVERFAEQLRTSGAAHCSPPRGTPARDRISTLPSPR